MDQCIICEQCTGENLICNTSLHSLGQLIAKYKDGYIITFVKRMSIYTVQGLLDEKKQISQLLLLRKVLQCCLKRLKEPEKAIKIPMKAL